MFSFVKLEPAPDAGIAIRRLHAQHVAVQVTLARRLDAGNRETKCDHFSAVVRPEDVAADPADHHQEAHREQFDIVEAPDDLLQAQHIFEFRKLEELANFDYRLACCHSSSISAILESSSFRPRSASLRSM